jgi:hypothetical protein
MDRSQIGIHKVMKKFKRDRFSCHLLVGERTIDNPTNVEPDLSSRTLTQRPGDYIMEESSVPGQC